jgi:hypothetical protein
VHRIKQYSEQVKGMRQYADCLQVNYSTASVTR